MKLPKEQKDEQEPHSHFISTNQVLALLDVADRYLPKSKYTAISKEREMMKYGILYEIMEIANLYFKDDDARWSGTPEPARD